MTIPFRHALLAKQKGDISWDGYIHVLFARHSGIKHEEDNIGDTDTYLRYHDPFAHMV